MLFWLHIEEFPSDDDKYLNQVIETISKYYRNGYENLQVYTSYEEIKHGSITKQNSLAETMQTTNTRTAVCQENIIKKVQFNLNLHIQLTCLH